MSNLPRICVYSLGGTIAMAGDVGQGANLALNADDLVKQIPSLEKVAHVSSRTFLSKPSCNISFNNLLSLAAEIRQDFGQGVDGIVVIQGTDSMEESAFALDLLLGGVGPVVVTGAMRTAETPGADGPYNIHSAVVAAASSALKGVGVTVVMNGDIHAARFVAKSHTAKTSAFTSPDCGPMGIVAEGEVHMYMVPAARPVFDFNAIMHVPSVALYTSSLGDEGQLLTNVKEAGYAGLVMEAFGAGHLETSCADKAEKIAASMPVVLASRAGAGPVFRRTYGYEGGEVDLQKRGLIVAGGLSACKSRILLAFLLAVEADKKQISQAFQGYL